GHQKRLIHDPASVHERRAMHAPMGKRGRRATGGNRGLAPGGGMLRPFAPLFHRMLDRIDDGVASGSLDTMLPDGTRRLLGGRRAGPDAIVEIQSWRALLRLASGG